MRVVCILLGLSDGTAGEWLDTPKDGAKYELNSRRILETAVISTADIITNVLLCQHQRYSQLQNFCSPRLLPRPPHRY